MSMPGDSTNPNGCFDKDHETFVHPHFLSVHIPACIWTISSNSIARRLGVSKPRREAPNSEKTTDFGVKRAPKKEPLKGTP